MLIFMRLYYFGNYNKCLNTIKLQKQPECPSLDQWVKMWYMYTIQYSAIQSKEILPFATTWMEVEGIMLSKISQAEKDKAI